MSAGALVDAIAAGRVVVTSGPWLEVSLDGRGPGETVPRPDDPELEILVDAANWVPVDRLRVIVDGQTVDSRALGADLPARIVVPLTLPDAASYVMVVVDGDRPLPPLAGTRAAPMRSTAFSNPIWIAPR